MSLECYSCEYIHKCELLSNFFVNQKQFNLLIHRCVKVSKYGVFSGPYFPIFSPNTGKYRPGKTSYLDVFRAVHHSHERDLLM